METSGVSLFAQKDFRNPVRIVRWPGW